MFYICLSKNSTGQGLREWVGEEEHVTFLNRTECLQMFNIQDDDNQIQIIETIISRLPPKTVVLFDEVPLFSKMERRHGRIQRGRFSYDWSMLENLRPEEVTVVVCIQPIRIAATFKNLCCDVTVPADADVIRLSSQYRSSNNILQFVNQMCRVELPIEYINVHTSPSHDVLGPEITAISISSFDQANRLAVWLHNHLQQELGCRPSQTKMIHMPSTERLAHFVIHDPVFHTTGYENSLISVDDFQGCETPVAVCFWEKDSNFSKLLEMCSRAQYKLILVIYDNEPLFDVIRYTKTQISVQNVSDMI